MNYPNRAGMDFRIEFAVWRLSSIPALGSERQLEVEGNLSDLIERFSAGTVVRRQNLTYVDVRFWRHINCPEKIKKCIMAVDP